jgi:hypothetical protein
MPEHLDGEGSMKTTGKGRLSVASLALLIALSLAGCNSPTAPRLPQPDKDPPPKDDEDSVRPRAGRSAMTFTYGMISVC